MNVLVDSDILIDVARARDQQLLDRWRQLEKGRSTVCYSPVTSAEVWAGARSQEYPVIEGLFEGLTCANIDETTGRWAGDFLRQFARSHGLKIADALMAASAVRHRALLWTGNHKHYPMREIEFY